MTEPQYKAYLHICRLSDKQRIHSVGLKYLSERQIERVMLGMMTNMNTNDYYIDDDEAWAALDAQEKQP